MRLKAQAHTVFDYAGEVIYEEGKVGPQAIRPGRRKQARHTNSSMGRPNRASLPSTTTLRATGSSEEGRPDIRYNVPTAHDRLASLTCSAGKTLRRCARAQPFKPTAPHLHGAGAGHWRPIGLDWIYNT